MLIDFHKNRFQSIQTLRGLAAILVVTEHIRFLASGAYGVDIFFCISGFMIMLTTHTNTDYFFRKRLLRIVPLYYLMTIGTYCLLLLFPTMFEQTSASIPNLIKSLLFIPFDMGNGIIQPLMRIGWTVNCEMFFYLLFWLSYHISHKYRGLICTLLLFATTAIGAIISRGQTITGENLMVPQMVSASDPNLLSPWLAPVVFYTSPIMLEFTFGILVYYLARLLYQNTYLRRKRFPAIVLLLAGVFLLIVLFVTADRVNILGYRRLLVWGFPAMIVVLCFFTAGLTLRMPTFCVKLGDISFSLYLIHYYPIMLLDRKIFDFSALTTPSAIGAVCGILLVILLSILVWYLIEKKLTGWLRRMLLP